MIKTISSLQNPLIKHLTKLNQNKKYRETCNSVILEGKILIEELSPLISIKTLCTTDPKNLPLNCETTSTLIVTEEILKKIAGTKNPEGLIAEVSIPNEQSLKNSTHIIAFDGIQDPGNLGTLLRTALAFNWNGAFFLPGCCDLWNDKAVRAAKGATFKLPFKHGTWQYLEELIEKNQLRPLAANIRGASINSKISHENILLVVGNESKGLSKETIDHCQEITIPIAKEMESLNVAIAGGILMYLLKKS